MTCASTGLYLQSGGLESCLLLLLRPLLKSFGDPDPRVRYYACEVRGSPCGRSKSSISYCAAQCYFVHCTSYVPPSTVFNLPSCPFIWAAESCSCSFLFVFLVIFVYVVLSLCGPVRLCILVHLFRVWLYAYSLSPSSQSLACFYSTLETPSLAQQPQQQQQQQVLHPLVLTHVVGVWVCVGVWVSGTAAVSVS